MAKEPKTDTKTDAEAFNEERRTKMQAEAKEAAERNEIEQALANPSLIPDGMSREQLLQQLRDMRAKPGANEIKYTPPPLTERMKEQLRLEQEAGRAAVAKAEAEAARAREARERAAAEDAAGGKK